MDLTVLEKSKKIRAEVLKKFETLSLFVIIKRVDANLWDWVFAGKKLDQSENLKIIADLIRKELDQNEILSISRIVLLNSEDPFAVNFNSTFSVDDGNGCLTINESQVNNVRIKEAYLFYSKTHR